MSEVLISITNEKGCEEGAFCFTYDASATTWVKYIFAAKLRKMLPPGDRYDQIADLFIELGFSPPILGKRDVSKIPLPGGGSVVFEFKWD